MKRGDWFEPIDGGNMAILLGNDGDYYSPIEWRSCDSVPSVDVGAFDLTGMVVLADAQFEPDDWDSSYFYLLGRLPDGRYVTCEAWNDSTGWGCQDGRTWTVASNLQNAVVHGLSQEARAALGVPGDGVAALAWERELADSVSAPSAANEAKGEEQ